MANQFQPPDSLLNARYTILQQIGAGGIASIYLARDERINKQVAVKFLTIPTDERNSEEWVTRFQNEIDIHKILSSYENIVNLIDYGNEDDAWFIIMDYMEGGDLANRLPQYLEMDMSERLSKVSQLVQDIAKALTSTHENDIIHRDIKPGTILFDKDDTAYLSDFSISKNLREYEETTQAGMAVGTIKYMPPEAIEGNSNKQSDQYALACTIYEVLTGQSPFDGTGIMEVLNNILKREPLRIDRTPDGRGYPHALSNVIERALSKDPKERYPSVLAFADAFEEAIYYIDTQLDFDVPVLKDESNATQIGQLISIPKNRGNFLGRIFNRKENLAYLRHKNKIIDINSENFSFGPFSSNDYKLDVLSPALQFRITANNGKFYISWTATRIAPTKPTDSPIHVNSKRVIEAEIKHDDLITLDDERKILKYHFVLPDKPFEDKGINWETISPTFASQSSTQIGDGRIPPQSSTISEPRPAGLASQLPRPKAYKATQNIVYYDGDTQILDRSVEEQPNWGLVSNDRYPTSTSDSVVSIESLDFDLDRFIGVGTEISGNTIIKRIGAGGLANIYRARDEGLNRPTVLKVVRKLDSKIAIQIFENEAQILARLRHPNIASIYRFGDFETTLNDGSSKKIPYISMPYYEGGTLRTALPNLDDSAKQAIINELFEALAYAHQQNNAHGDLKPENVMLSGTNPILIDWGLVPPFTEIPMKLEQSRGTPNYSAPEILEAKPISPLIDVYSMGLLIYEIVTGTSMYSSNDWRGLNPDLANVIHRATRVNPEDRYQSMSEMREAYTQALSSRDTSIAYPAFEVYERYGTSSRADAQDSLPKVYNFLEAYGVNDVASLNIAQRWQHNRQPENASWPRIPIAVTENGEVKHITLSAEEDGHHLFVAGDSGTGKSEFITSFILAIASEYDPQTAQMILIGDEFSKFKNLPHVADLIENPDENTMQIVFDKLSREIARRDAILGGENIIDYRRKANVSSNLSHLFVLISEQLTGYYGEIKGLLDVGRAIGIHFIHMGAMDDLYSTRTETSVRLAFYRISHTTITDFDSNHIYNLSKYLPRNTPGRAYIQGANQSEPELIQIMWSGKSVLNKNDVTSVDTISGVVSDAISKAAQEMGLRAESLLGIIEYDGSSEEDTSTEADNVVFIKIAPDAGVWDVGDTHRVRLTVSPTHEPDSQLLSLPPDTTECMLTLKTKHISLKGDTNFLIRPNQRITRLLEGYGRRPGEGLIWAEVQANNEIQSSDVAVKVEILLPDSFMNEMPSLPEPADPVGLPTFKSDVILRLYRFWLDEEETMVRLYGIAASPYQDIPAQQRLGYRDVSRSLLDELSTDFANIIRNNSGASLAKAQLHQYGRRLWQTIMPPGLSEYYCKIMRRSDIKSVLLLVDSDPWLPFELAIPVCDGDEEHQTLALCEQFEIARFVEDSQQARRTAFPLPEKVYATRDRILNDSPAADHKPIKWKNGQMIVSNSGLDEGLHLQEVQAYHLIDPPEGVQTRQIVPSSDDATSIWQQHVEQYKKRVKQNGSLFTITTWRKDAGSLSNPANALHLMASGANALVSTWWAVDPAEDRVFWQAFYKALDASVLNDTSMTLGKAVQVGRNAVKRISKNPLSWLAYYAMGDPMAKAYTVLEAKGYLKYSINGGEEAEIELKTGEEYDLLIELFVDKPPPEYAKQRYQIQAWDSEPNIKIEITDNGTIEPTPLDKPISKDASMSWHIKISFEKPGLKGFAIECLDSNGKEIAKTKRDAWNIDGPAIPTEETLILFAPQAVMSTVVDFSQYPPYYTLDGRDIEVQGVSTSGLKAQQYAFHARLEDLMGELAVQDDGVTVTANVDIEAISKEMNNIANTLFKKDWWRNHHSESYMSILQSPVSIPLEFANLNGADKLWGTEYATGYIPAQHKVDSSIHEIHQTVALVDDGCKYQHQILKMDTVKDGQKHLRIRGDNPIEHLADCLRRSRGHILHIAGYSDIVDQKPVLYLNTSEGQKIELKLPFEDSTLFENAPMIILTPSWGKETKSFIGVTEFAEAFIQLGASAVVTSFCALPDALHQAFIHQFYQLLHEDNELSVGQALRITRKKLMAKHHNPLVLGYVLFGNPDLRIKMA